MTTIPQVSQAMQELLTTAAQAADAKLHYTKRPDRAKFSAATLTQTLVLGFLAHPDARVEQLAHSAARVGGDVSPQAIDQRFTVTTAALLQEIVTSSMQHLIGTDPVAELAMQPHQRSQRQDLFIHDADLTGHRYDRVEQRIGLRILALNPQHLAQLALHAHFRPHVVQRTRQREYLFIGLAGTGLLLLCCGPAYSACPFPSSSGSRSHHLFDQSSKDSWFHAFYG